jgi:hypothetical protein
MPGKKKRVFRLSDKQAKLVLESLDREINRGRIQPVVRNKEVSPGRANQ